MLAACAHKQPPPAVIYPKTLGGAAWLLEDLAGRGVIDNSHATLQFMADGKVAGTGGCNRYSGSWRSRDCRSSSPRWHPP